MLDHPAKVKILIQTHYRNECQTTVKLTIYYVHIHQFDITQLTY